MYSKNHARYQTVINPSNFLNVCLLYVAQLALKSTICHGKYSPVQFK